MLCFVESRIMGHSNTLLYYLFLFFSLAYNNNCDDVRNQSGSYFGSVEKTKFVIIKKKVIVHAENEMGYKE